jgi:hypothetical protein
LVIAFIGQALPEYREQLSGQEKSANRNLRFGTRLIRDYIKSRTTKNIAKNDENNLRSPSVRTNVRIGE